MLADKKFLIVGAGFALVALLLLKKNATAVGEAVGGAAVEIVGGVVGGVSQGIGDAIGIPRTNETECQKALREGRYWDASFSCPAGDFIGGAAGGVSDTVKGWFE